MDANPIKSFSGGDRIMLPAGVYPATLASVRSKEVADTYHPGQMKIVIIFKFDVQTTAGVACTFKRTSCGMGPKSTLVPFAHTLAGSKWQNVHNTDADALWTLLQSLVGTQHQVVVSPDGDYNSLQAVLPMPAEQDGPPESTDY
jgi:hypothetical protein